MDAGKQKQMTDRVCLPKTAAPTLLRHAPLWGKQPSTDLEVCFLPLNQDPQIKPLEAPMQLLIARGTQGVGEGPENRAQDMGLSRRPETPR